MGSGESKEKTESTKSETNISMIQFHWQSFGLGASSIVLGILALGLLVLLICWFRLRCTKFFSAQPGPTYGYGNMNGYRGGGTIIQIPNNEIQLSPLNTQIAPPNILTYNNPTMESGAEQANILPPPSQAALATAYQFRLSNLHQQRRATLANIT